MRVLILTLAGLFMTILRLLTALLCLVFVVPQGHTQEFELQHNHSDQAEPTEKRTEYVCPMHSHIVSDEPGSCPICGMDLEPRQRQEEKTVQVSGSMQQNLAIRTTTVQYDTLWRYYPTIAQVAWNDNARHHVHARAAGWIEELYVRSEGSSVKQGDRLYDIYSRDLVVAQQDLLQALANGTSNARLIRDAKLRLELLGFAPQLIKEIEKTREIMYRVPVYAPQAGVVTELNVVDGMYVEPGLSMLTLTGDESFWLIADVPERYSDWLSVGAPVDVTLPQANLDGYETEIEYIYPSLDAQARTQRVRIKLPNSRVGSNLLVGMQAQVELYGGPKRDALTVPLSSLIVTGSNNRVIVKTNDNTFEQRDVHVGLVIGEQAEILHGLEEGEQVVVSGQFLLDSEATLLNSRATGEQEATDAHAHH
ncbi:efflux RND transporter periplasmic adaptor subunit [Pseudidiomarina marina]|uniref:Efflux RND transporter periplasmic adaptor subunit n=2 Tax=Pseudidiomarina marina TaxID=502366 RepID=A0A432YFN4_9GAMM|nr:efflux RND transporter periplasmic adaptor subunit [Pseudidiomarina marina]